MRITAFVCDFHGTIQPLTEEAVARLRELRVRGVRLILNTSADLGRLTEPGGLPAQALRLFDVVVAEDGGVLLEPQTGVTRRLAPPPDPEVVAELGRRGVPADEMWTGDTVVGVRARHAAAARGAVATVRIRRGVTGRPPLIAEVFENHGAVVIHWPGRDKLSGLHAALDLLGIASLRGVVGAGDGPRDRVWLRHCGAAIIPAGSAAGLARLPNAVPVAAPGEPVVAAVQAMLTTPQRVAPGVE